jgi:dipeptidyl aminopeptidase/acylaminoacyl peptidase
MNRQVPTVIRLRRPLPVATLALLAALGCFHAWPSAQAPAKKPIAIDDYAKWRTITDTAISGDGRWVTYVLQLTNTIPAEAKPVLHLKNLDTNEEIKVEHASGGVFSVDSKWIAYQVDPGAAERARRERRPGGSGSGSGSTGQTPPADPATPPSAPAPPPAVAPAPPPPGTPAPTTPAVTPATPPSTPATPSPAPAVAPSTPPAPVQPATPPGGAPQTPSSGAGPSTGSGRAGSATAAIPPRRVELRNLATGAVQSWQDIGSFTFSPLSTHLFLRRRAAEGAGGGRGGGGAAPGGAAPAGGGRGSAETPAGPRGLDVILLDLRTGRHQLLGDVGDIAFNRTGSLLAYTVDAAVKDGNGLFVFDARGGRITPLDNDAKIYNRLAWNEDGTAVAVLKGSDVEKMREKDNLLMAFPEVPAIVGDEDVPVNPIVLDPAKTESFPKKWVISDRAPLTWSEDNKRVFFGIKEQVAAPDTTRRSTDETADVDVWNTADERIQSAQMIRADQERNFTFRQAFDVTAKRFVKLADETMRELDVAADGRWAVGRDTRGYIHDHKRPAADFYRVNTSTGERTLMLKGQLTGSHALGISPHGTQFLYWKDSRFHAYDLDAGASKPLGNGGPLAFTDIEFDYPGPKPSYGIAGYTSDGKALIAHHRYDLWMLPLDGGAATNLTNGAGTKNETRFRLVRTEPVDPAVHRATGPRGTFDLSKPLTLSAYGQWTKKAGFYELANGQLKELVYEDASFSVPSKAAKADRYLLTRQTFVEYPDLRVSGPGFKDSKKISDANPQQGDYLWGRRVLFEYKNRDGVRLQGVLALPDDYKPGEKRPMLVTFYEKNSQTLHRYNAPSYLSGMGGSPMEAVSRGYITMLPDIHFRTGSSHSDMLECVEAATRRVIELGYADPKRIGVTGHSYGGEGAAFIGVMSKMFAAVGMGAGVTDLYNDFSQNWGWAYQYSGGSGANGNDYYLFGQGRWGFSPWDNPDRYRLESALTHAPKASAPFLIMHGTSDATVDFNNGLGFYNALRYNGKKAVLLAYPGEGHGLRGVANRKDLTIRFFQFFDHYLKDAPAPKWMTDGVPFLKKDATDDSAKEWRDR